MTSTDTKPASFVVRAILIMLVWAALIGVGYWFVFGRSQGNSIASSDGASPNAEPTTAGREVTINIAYGTEKELWLKWAIEEFAKTQAGKRISVGLIPAGSLEGAQMVLEHDPARADDRRPPIHVWSPASSLYTQNFVNEWKLKHGNNPIVKSQALALSPMVFVMWRERYDAFISKYGKLDFDTLSQALSATGGWREIANKPEWGFFKFGHTHPGESNSGLLTLVLIAHAVVDKSTPLSLNDVLDSTVQDRIATIERGISGLERSTKFMMDQMVLRGPASFDGVMVYENLAIDYIPKAAGRWGKLYVVYPERNMWNDNPFYILDTPWSDRNHKRAAEELLSFLMSEPIQRKALEFGFRPGNPSVPVLFDGSPFQTLAADGIRNDVGTLVEPPEPQVIENLLLGWSRAVNK